MTTLKKNDIELNSHCSCEQNSCGLFTQTLSLHAEQSLPLLRPHLAQESKKREGPRRPAPQVLSEWDTRLTRELAARPQPVPLHCHPRATPRTWPPSEPALEVKRDLESVLLRVLETHRQPHTSHAPHTNAGPQLRGLEAWWPWGGTQVPLRKGHLWQPTLPSGLRASSFRSFCAPRPGAHGVCGEDAASAGRFCGKRTVIVSGGDHELADTRLGKAGRQTPCSIFTGQGAAAPRAVGARTLGHVLCLYKGGHSQPLGWFGLGQDGRGDYCSFNNEWSEAGSQQRSHR